MVCTDHSLQMIYQSIKRNEESLEITLKTQTIPYKDTTQFLGMNLESKLNWEEHIVRVRAKTKKALNLIKVVACKV